MSQRMVVLLRAVNLGPRNKIAMADLRSLLLSLGYGDVRTHLNSGNAVVTTDEQDPLAVERQVESALAAGLGLTVSVLVRTADEMAAVVAANPFAAVEPKKVQATFLSVPPSDRAVAAIRPDACAPDEFVVGNRVVYLWLRNGIQGARLPDWERLFGVRATMRGWNTVTRLCELAETTRAAP